jgi:16S rRNA G966 N2-methylase RsmD
MGGGMSNALDSTKRKKMGRTWTGGTRPIEELDETSRKNLAATESGVSVFDPVLCELTYRWFAPKEAKILDPFAGGSVRGIVASKLGHKYTGIELRAEQVEANRQQGKTICKENEPTWLIGDSMEVMNLVTEANFNLLFSCPPYADLEVYSDDPRDISNMPYPEFLKTYREIINRSIQKLEQDSFAVFVIGEVRSKKDAGQYYGFVPDTIKAFEDAGCSYYNEIILVTAIGSLPIRAGRIFQTTRKIGKTHQNILVFCKGDAKKAAKKCGEVPREEEALWESAVSTSEQF